MISKRILMPNGELRTYYCGDNQTWLQIITERILPYWNQYCDNNWLSENHEAIYAPEKRVKWFLDRLGWLLIEGADGIESEYKDMVHKVREIPVTECPADISDYLFSDRTPPGEEDDNERFERLLGRLNEIDKRKPPKPRPHKETKFERLEKIKASYPGCVLTWCIVDGENTFEFGGRRYSVPEEMRSYIEDSQMDRILAVENENRLAFYDQNVENMFVLR